MKKSRTYRWSLVNGKKKRVNEEKKRKGRNLEEKIDIMGSLLLA
jgi:hypothetical protein